MRIPQWFIRKHTSKEVYEDRIEDLRERLSAMSEKAVKLERALIDRDSRIQSMQKRITKQTAELTDLKKKVRKQTEADILLNALQAVGIVPADKPETDHLARHDVLHGQLQGLRNSNPYQGGGLAQSSWYSPYLWGLGL